MFFLCPTKCHCFPKFYCVECIILCSTGSRRENQTSKLIASRCLLFKIRALNQGESQGRRMIWKMENEWKIFSNLPPTSNYQRFQGKLPLLPVTHHVDFKVNCQKTLNYISYIYLFILLILLIYILQEKCQHAIFQTECGLCIFCCSLTGLKGGQVLLKGKNISRTGYSRTQIKYL